MTAFAAARGPGGDRIGTRFERLVGPVRSLPSFFRLEDRVYGNLFERTLEDARRLAPPPEPLNCALRSRAEVDDAARVLRDLRLRYLYDHPFKVWDGLRFFSFIVHRIEPSGSVLDFGSGPHANVLRWLELTGYSALRAVDVVFQRPVRRGTIEYFGDDVHRTRFDDGAFECAIAQSVIEHGIDVRRFLREARRVVRPGGHLLVSTDFWPEKVDTGDATMYGALWTIFSAAEIGHVVREAAEIGFHLVAPLDVEVAEPVLDVLGRRYTFLFMAFRLEA